MFNKALSLVLLTSIALSANENISLEDDFLNSLEEVSEIATKTKLNIDDSPAFVTVLHSSKLKALGVRDLFEALGLVAGVKLHRESSGVPVVVFRGAVQKGEVKLMVDGVTINNAYRGSIYHFLDFPIDMINRIEVIRGSGSVLYGSGAVSGVINIITNSSEKSFKNRLFTSIGSYGDAKGGAILTTELSGVKIGLDAYYHKNDKTIKMADHRLKDYSAGINIQGEKLGFLARVKESEAGEANGLFGIIDSDKDKYTLLNRSIYAEVSYKNRVSDKVKVELLGGFSQYTQDADALHSSGGDLHSLFEESSIFTQIDVISQTIDDNTLVVGARYEKFDANEATMSGVSTNPLADPDAERSIGSFYLNDNYSGVENTQLLFGFRYDNYSDFDDVYSPTLGAVYRVDDKLNLKATYSHSYRAPSWIELNTNSNLKAESSVTSDIGFIYKMSLNNILKVNFYRMEIDNMIVKPARIYEQSGEALFYGTELEYHLSPMANLELDFSFSYIDAKDENSNTIANVADTLSNISLLYKFKSGLSIGSLFKYVSKTSRESTERRDDMDESFIYDQTLSYIYDIYRVNITIKDMFDNGTTYASPKGTYLETDLENEGRTILLNASWEF